MSQGDVFLLASLLFVLCSAGVAWFAWSRTGSVLKATFAGIAVIGVQVLAAPMLVPLSLSDATRIALPRVGVLLVVAAFLAWIVAQRRSED